MIQIQKFSFNAFQVNTLVLFDETRECIIIDAACYEDGERKELVVFIKKNKLKPIKLINTHCHIDHILGCNFACNYFNIGLDIHKDGEPFLENAVEHGMSFGFSIEPLVKPSNYIVDGDSISFGKSNLKVLYTPGHADGSICLYNEDQKFIIVGDVLFQGSIGRTDLLTGNFEVLKTSIHDKLFTLEDDVQVISGHGPDTSIGFEKQNNPFVGLGI
jgi:glyoxylase-like metal-dependent hydrolase (beta-lactamase superfamily II)